jgi:hypothetical protein
MKLNVFKVYSRAVHSYLLVLEAVTTGRSAANRVIADPQRMKCNSCDIPFDVTYALTLGGLTGPWEFWNGKHVLTLKDSGGSAVQNCSWYDSTMKIHLYPVGFPGPTPWVVSLILPTEDPLVSPTLKWSTPTSTHCDIVGNYGEGISNMADPISQFCAAGGTLPEPVCVAQGVGATTCVVSENVEDTNIFVCFNDPEPASSASSSSDESSSAESSSSSPVAAAPLYQIYPNRTLVSIASLSDLDILPIDVPDDRLYRASTVTMMFRSLSQLEAVLASVISDAQVIARLQNYDIQVTGNSTSEDPLHDIDPGDLYNIP